MIGWIRHKKERTGVFLLVLALIGAISGFASAGELLKNGGFESGTFGGYWVDGARDLFGRSNPLWADHAVSLDMPYSGNYSALLGFKYTGQRRNRYGFMYQDVTIPSNISSATLYFKFRQQGFDGSGYDPFVVEIRDLSNNTLATVVNFSFNEWDNQFKDSGWIDDDGTGPVGYDMSSYAGMTVRLFFAQYNLWDNLYETWVYVDDVSLVYRKFVDLAVDGDGDDVFADPGTGDGGSSTKSCMSGDTLYYSLIVENEGMDADSYDLTISIPPGWSAVVRYNGTDYNFPWTTPQILPQEVIEAQVIVYVPQGASTASYEMIVDAISTSNSNRFDSVRLIANVLQTVYGTDLVIDSDGLGEIDPSGAGGESLREAPRDTEITYSLELYNTGNVVDSYLVWFDTDSPLSLSVEFNSSMYTGPFIVNGLPQGSIASMLLHIYVPAGIAGGNYESFVHSRSLTDTLKVDCVKAITRVIAPGVDMIVAGSGDDIIDASGSGLGGSSTISGTRGSVVYFPLTVQNEGAVVDSFSLSWVPPGNGWSAVIVENSTNHPLPWVTGQFDPDSDKEYYLAISVPGNVGYGTYRSVLNATSSVDPNIRESISAIVSVGSGNEVDLMIDGNGDGIYAPYGTGLGGESSRQCDPGDTIYFTIDVENENGENLFDIDWVAPDGWVVTIQDSSSSLRGVPAGSYTMMVCVPYGCKGGGFEVVVNGTKTNKPYFVDSVKGVIFVSVAHVVDVVIDGNGDGVYGVPGSGAGGMSVRDCVPGGSVAFDLEVQNEGGEDESYTVTWNSIAGWVAEIDGSPSPYSTEVVAPGESIHIEFKVTTPQDASEGNYSYVIDIVSTVDSTNVESVTATIHIPEPPKVDLVIDGDGSGSIAPWGSGDGGTAVVNSQAGTIVSVELQVFNTGGVVDSFLISWSDPPSWPAGSVVISDGTGDHTSPYVTDTISAGASKSFTIKVSIPSDAAEAEVVVINAKPVSYDFFDSVKLEIRTSAYLTVVVFDDYDHDAVMDVSESGIDGVRVLCIGGTEDLTLETDAGGVATFAVEPFGMYSIVEVNPEGFISLSPDTLNIGSSAAGDTVTVYFADVKVSEIVPDNDVSAPAGGVVDIPHRLIAGTPGQATLDALVPAGWAEVFYRDVNANGVLDSSDVRLTSGDLALDPELAGSDIVYVIMRLFVPPTVPPGSRWSVPVKLEQTLTGTTLVTTDEVVDAVTVLARASGLLRLVKSVDMPQARPGDIITYTINFANPGAEPVREIVIFDPVSDAVELVSDAFGSGRDVEWIKNGTSYYLTFDPSDSDEAMFDSGNRILKVELSRQSEFVLQSGAQGTLIYRVRIK